MVINLRFVTYNARDFGRIKRLSDGDRIRSSFNENM